MVKRSNNEVACVRRSKRLRAAAAKKKKEEVEKPLRFPRCRFSLYHVEKRQKMKDFVARNKLKFRVKHNYFEFREHRSTFGKELLIFREDSRDFFAFDDKLASSLEKGNIPFKIFVQSKSHGRVLLQNSLFLYEWPMWRAEERSAMRTAFLMGFHPRLGKDSPLLAFGQSRLLDNSLLKYVFYMAGLYDELAVKFE